MIAPFRARLDALEARINDALPGPLKVGFLMLYLFSTASADWFDALARRRGVGRWADAGIGVLLGLQVGGMALVAGAAWQALGRTRATALNDPVNAVALPGVNDFMPLAAAPYVVAGLVVATVVHEAGHALVCRRANVAVTEWGVALLFGLLPLAAYVLPDEAIEETPIRTKLRLYAVGVFHNLLVAVVALALLASPLSSGSPLSAYLTYFGWALTGGSPPTAAAVAGLGAVTNLAFWLALLNANFALLNALPVSAFDGGRVLSLALRASADRLGVPVSPLAESLVVHAASLLAVALVVVALLGPALPV